MWNAFLIPWISLGKLHFMFGKIWNSEAISSKFISCSFCGELSRNNKITSWLKQKLANPKKICVGPFFYTPTFNGLASYFCVRNCLLRKDIGEFACVCRNFCLVPPRVLLARVLTACFVYLLWIDLTLPSFKFMPHSNSIDIPKDNNKNSHKTLHLINAYHFYKNCKKHSDI